MGALAAAPAALADGKRIDDPRGDVIESAANPRPSADYDIVTAAHGHAGRRNVRHAVQVAGTAEVGDDHTVHGSGVRIEIDTARGRPGDCNGNARDPLGRAEYIVSFEGVIDCTTGGIPEADPVRVDKRGADTIVFTLDQRSIGNPNRYRWYASTGTAEVVDFAPDLDARGRPAYTMHTLRRPGAVRQCRDPQQSGAGAFNIRAKSVGCRTARRVARRYWESGGDKRFAGWRCRSKRTGYETSKARCAKRHNGLKRVVAFEFGA